nr:MAG TPA: hypothetical protein [Caudoviricetes sp.]DAO57565.1 MAG TPA: hypothetical protein [Caudoviricetes sp.]
MLGLYYYLYPYKFFPFLSLFRYKKIVYKLM